MELLFFASRGDRAVKCPSCGYENPGEAVSCNLCRTLLKAKPAKPSAAAATIRVDPKLAEAASLRATPIVLPQPTATSRDDTRPKHYLRPVGAPAIELEIGKVFTFGRSNESTLVIPSGRVSRIHAEIRWDGARALLADKGSANGTSVGGKPIKEHELRSGDEIEIGPFFCTYLIERTAPLPTSGEGPMEATQTISSAGGLMAGRIEPTTIAELLQSIELNEKTGTLDIFGLEGGGWLQAKEGVLLAAEMGGKQDEEAVIAMLGVTRGRFTFMPNVTEERRIKQTITALLLEFGRRADESKLAQGEGSSDAPAEAHS
jgi:hypothetical protein